MQDFNDIHKKIKGKIMEDMRFYSRFLDISLELILKPPISEETLAIIEKFLSNLAKLIKKNSNLFKHSSRNIQMNLIKILAKSEFPGLHIVILKIFLNNNKLCFQ